MDAKNAILHLSSLAADFKVGIVSDEFVRDMLAAIINSMAIEDRDAVLKQALGSWFIDQDEL